MNRIARLIPIIAVLALFQPDGVNVRDARIDRLEKLSDHRYMRLVEIEQWLDKSGALTSCWDSGGFPGAPCVCPEGSSWVVEFEDAACQWDEPAARPPSYGLPEPEPYDGPSDGGPLIPPPPSDGEGDPVAPGDDGPALAPPPGPPDAILNPEE